MPEQLIYASKLGRGSAQLESRGDGTRSEGDSPGKTSSEKSCYNEFKPHRSKPQKNPEKNIGSNHILILGEENFLIL